MTPLTCGLASFAAGMLVALALAARTYRDLRQARTDLKRITAERDAAIDRHRTLLDGLDELADRLNRDGHEAGRQVLRLAGEHTEIPPQVSAHRGST